MTTLSLSEFLEKVESIAADRRRKPGKPPKWPNLVEVRALLCGLIEVAKERQDAKGKKPSDRKAFTQVEAYFEALSVASHRRALSTGDSPFKPYSFDQIKRAQSPKRAVAPDDRNKILSSTWYSGFKRFLDEQDAKPARPKSGVVQ
jgi:hypothetical protein